MNSEVGLVIQFSGILLIAVLMVFLTGSLKSTALKYWKYAWFALALALISVFIAIEFKAIAKPFFLFYYLGEYVFAYLLIAGCRNYASGKEITVRSFYWLIPALLIAAFFTYPFGGFNIVFNSHYVIMAAAFGTAFFALQSSKQTSQNNTGWRVMRAALCLLTLDFLQYAVIYTLRSTSSPQLLGSHLSFSSAIDLVLEILLGFGMVIILLEQVRQNLEETNYRLKEAHDKLEQVAHVDPLTDAFTRHAFYNFLQKHNHGTNVISGCVGVFDIDNLKPVNDHFGHAVGDVAISQTASAIRSLVRADDLIFRWGGDEFFVIMLGFDTNQAIERMCELNTLLKDIKAFGAPEKISIRVSFGFADFSDVLNLEKAIERADAEMYSAKQRNKYRDKDSLIIPLQTPPPEKSVTIN